MTATLAPQPLPGHFASPTLHPAERHSHRMPCLVSEKLADGLAMSGCSTFGVSRSFTSCSRSTTTHARPISQFVSTSGTVRRFFVSEFPDGQAGANEYARNVTTSGITVGYADVPAMSAITYQFTTPYVQVRRVVGSIPLQAAISASIILFLHCR